MWRAFAPSIVAISTTALALRASGLLRVIFASFAARSISSIRSRSLLLPLGRLFQADGNSGARMSGNREKRHWRASCAGRIVDAANIFCGKELLVRLIHEMPVCCDYVRARIQFYRDTARGSFRFVRGCRRVPFSFRRRESGWRVVFLASAAASCNVFLEHV